MLEAAVIVLRLLQYAGTMILFGSSLFLVYALPHTGRAAAASLNWPRRLLAGGALALLAGSIIGLVAQTSVLAGSLLEGIKLESLTAVVTTMALGPSSLIRICAAAVSLIMLSVLKPGRTLWLGCAVLGAAACMSFAWMGHGAATAGPGYLLHLGSDIVHTLAAALWIGALAAFVLLLWPSRTVSTPTPATLYDALRRFSGLGPAIVAVIAASGLINGWFLVGPRHLPELFTSLYGQLLVLKLGLFVAMLSLAAANRLWFTPALDPRLGGLLTTPKTLAGLRWSLALETGAAVLVLGLIAWLGALAPVSSL